jgi:hypothetical protein
MDAALLGAQGGSAHVTVPAGAGFRVYIYYTPSRHAHNDFMISIYFDEIFILSLILFLIF